MEEGKRRAFQATDFVWFLSLSLISFIALVLTNRFYGMVWDEGFYYPVFVKTRAWVGELFTNPIYAFSREAVDLYWQERSEVPPLTKFIGALSIGTGFGGNPLLAMRLVTMVLFSLTVGMIFLISGSIFHYLKAWQASLPAFLYLFHPRLFGHGHFAATETVFAFLTVLFIFVLVVLPISLKKRIWISYLILALAIATKVNGLILCVASICYLIYLVFYQAKQNEEEKFSIKDIFFLTLGYPAVFLMAWMIWPWMWYDTGIRIAEYWAFIRDHAHIAIWYLGEPHNETYENVPWHYPIIMTVVVTPVVSLLAVIFGMIFVGKEHLRPHMKLPSPNFVLLALLILGPLSAMIVTGAPKYDGVRLFLPVFAPLILFSPAIFSLFELKKAKIIFAAIITLLLIESVPFAKTAMNFYNFPTMLVSPDEPDFLFEKTYWMESMTPEVFENIATISGKSEDEEIRIITRALFPEVIQIQQEWGTIPQNIVLNQGAEYDFHLIQFRKGLWKNVDWTLYLERENLVDDPLMADSPRFLVLDGELLK